MLLSKRDQARIERQLAKAFTEACEAGKAQMVGFSWLTHLVDYGRFPESLQITWIFTTEAHKADALGQGQDALMEALTRTALEDAGIDIEQLIAPLRFDSEEACKRTDGGDWPRRLARGAATRH